MPKHPGDWTFPPGRSKSSFPFLISSHIIVIQPITDFPRTRTFDNLKNEEDEPNCLPKISEDDPKSSEDFQR